MTRRFPQACDECRFFASLDPDGHHGECRRWAPRPRLLGGAEASDPLAIWPEIMAEDWCGEFEPRKGETNP